LPAGGRRRPLLLPRVAGVPADTTINPGRTNDVHVLRLAVWTAAAVVMLGGFGEGATRRVCASGCDYTDVQAAVDAAQPGDTILLRAGETFIGHVILRKKSGTGEILIRSDAADSELPAPGVRLVPEGRPGANTSLTRLARLRGRGATWRTTPLIRTEAGAHDYRLQFLEMDGVAQEGYGTLIELGNNTSQTSTSLVPYRITLDRLYVHGQPIRGQKRCLTLDSASTDVLNSYFADCKHQAEDSQAIAGFNGPGPFRIVNNYIEAATENIMFGGSDPRIPNLVPSDIEIRRNHITKQLAWRNPIMSPPASPRASTSSASGSLSARTHYFKVVAIFWSAGSLAVSAPSSEISIAIPSGTTAASLSWGAVAGAERYRIYRGTSAGGENVFMETPGSSTTFVYTGVDERSGAPPTKGSIWNVKNLIELKNAQRVTIEGNLIERVWKASQNGFAIVLTPRNQDNNAPWSVVQDVTLRYNIVRHANAGVSILGYDYSAPTGSQLTRRIKLLHNVFDDIGGTWGGGIQFVLITNGPSDVVIDHNTVFHSGHVVTVDNGQSTGFVFNNNLARHNQYGILGSGAGIGTAAFAAYFPGGVMRRNVLAGGNASLYPSDNFFPSVEEFNRQFVDLAGGDYRLVAGSPYIGRATDGTNIGADIAAIAAAQQGGGAPSPSPGNVSPTANAGGPYTGVEGSSLTVDGSGSRDSDGSIGSYVWDWGDGSAAGSGVRASHTYTRAGSYTVRLTVTDNAGATASATTTATIQSSTSGGATDDIVLTSADVTRTSGEWRRVASSSGSDGQVMAPTERGWWTSEALASPTHYFEVPFQAGAGTYRLWLRMRAASPRDDSVFVQLTGAVSSSGAPLWRVGTTSALLVNLENCDGCGVSGWGWQDNGHWLGTSSVVRFQAAGPQTIRIQTREDGVQIDQIVLSPVRYASTAPGSPTNDGIMLPRSGGALAARDVVLRTVDVTSRRGNWSPVADPAGAGGYRMNSQDQGWFSGRSALASPPSYFEIPFTAVGGVRYRVWLRMGGEGNSLANNSVWLQYTDIVTSSGAPYARIGSSSGVLLDRESCSGCGMSGWGWLDSSWWTGQNGYVQFTTSGTQTLRVQIREDGVRIDQIVLSPSRYLSSAPGAKDRDRTWVRPDGTPTTY
jgi:PKD repeat protein